MATKMKMIEKKLIHQVVSQASDGPEGEYVLCRHRFRFRHFQWGWLEQELRAAQGCRVPQDEAVKRYLRALLQVRGH